MITTIIILSCLGFGAMIGLCLAFLIIPASVNDAWHEGYDAARHDFAETPEAMATPTILRNPKD